MHFFPHPFLLFLFFPDPFLFLLFPQHSLLFFLLSALLFFISPLLPLFGLFSLTFFLCFTLFPKLFLPPDRRRAATGALRGGRRLLSGAALAGAPTVRFFFGCGSTVLLYLGDCKGNLSK